jgi:hypothetical protein
LCAFYVRFCPTQGCTGVNMFTFEADDELISVGAVTCATSLLGTKRQFARCKAMSGVGGKADLPIERPDFSV